MFNISSSESKYVLSLKKSTTSLEKEKDMFKKLSRIQEDYIDAAIHSVRKRFSGRKNFRYE
jgi:hypothetical protein